MFPTESHSGVTRPWPETLLLLWIDMEDIPPILLQAMGDGSDESFQPWGS